MLSRIGYLAGAFDMFNVGDLDAIQQAKSLCDRLIVGVLPDDEVAAIRGSKPVVRLAERLEIVAHVRQVDQAVVHSSAEDPQHIYGAELIFFNYLPNTEQAASSVHELSSVRMTSSDMLRSALSLGDTANSSVA